MKKILLLMVAAVMAVASMAETKQYTDQLVVTVNDEETRMTTSVEVEFLEDDYIDFRLRNFMLSSGSEDMYVGNIEINNLFLTDKGSYKTFSYNANLQIKDGDLEGVDTWVGPMLGNVPLVLKGKLTDSKLYVTIDIDMMSSISQMIFVKFGTDFEAPTITDTKAFTATLKSQMTSLDPGNYGAVLELDDAENYSATLQILNTGNFNFILNNIAISFGGESLTLGNLTLNDVETTNRGEYNDLTWSGTAAFEDGAAAGVPFPCTLKGKYDGNNLYYALTVGESDAWEAIYDFVFGIDFAPLTPIGAGKIYDDKLVVTVDEETTAPMDAHVLVTPLDNGGINFTLKNFTMVLSGNEMHVGNIEIADLKLYDGNSYQYFNYSNNLTILPGDEEGVDVSEYIGPLLGEIPLRMRGRMTTDRLYVVIDIDMEVGGIMQVIHVEFGSMIADGINSIESDLVNGELANGRCYDLAGRLITKATKGIYIVNGKKVVR